MSVVYKPEGYRNLLGSEENTEKAIKLVKDMFQTNLAAQLSLLRVTAPMVVLQGTGLNDDLSGVERPVSFPIKDMDERKAEVVHSLAKWKRLKLAQLGVEPGRGLYTDMNALRPDEELDNIHSIYVDQWDWERVITREERNLEFLKKIVRRIYEAVKVTENLLYVEFPQIVPILPEEIFFVHAEELARMWPELTPKEREDVYAFNVGIYLEKIVNKICRECPEVIVDFDITEGNRSVGLGFLSVGKYFLINNGPYFQNYGIPYDPNTVWSNIFVRPGEPRTWICRSPMTFDKWIPSVLFLTHYLPDDPINSQDINLASLILGQNGIWGDLPKVSPEGRAHFGEVLSHYKQVRDDITAEAAIKSGMTGSGFECYEKINSKTGKGVVCVFSTVRDTFRYITEKKTVQDVWSTAPVKVTQLPNGTSMIEIDFNNSGAAIVFFGAGQNSF